MKGYSATTPKNITAIGLSSSNIVVGKLDCFIYKSAALYIVMARSLLKYGE